MFWIAKETLVKGQAQLTKADQLQNKDDLITKRETLLFDYGCLRIWCNNTVSSIIAMAFPPPFGGFTQRFWIFIDACSANKTDTTH